VKVLVFGAGGQVGAEVCPRKAGPDGSSSYLSIGNAADITKPTVVSGRDRAGKARSGHQSRRLHRRRPRRKSEPTAAWGKSIVREAAHIAAVCGSDGSPLVHLSTDYVFDGAQERALLRGGCGRPPQCLWVQQGGRRAPPCGRRRLATSSCGRPGCTGPTGQIL